MAERPNLNKKKDETIQKKISLGDKAKTPGVVAVKNKDETIQKKISLGEMAKTPGVVAVKNKDETTQKKISLGDKAKTPGVVAMNEADDSSSFSKKQLRMKNFNQDFQNKGEFPFLFLLL